MIAGATQELVLAKIDEADDRNQVYGLGFRV